MVSSRQIASGFGWVMAINYANRLLGFVSMLILARLLSPAEFGIVAIASMVMEVLNLMKDMGFGEALIFQKREDDAAINTANTLLVATNAAFFLVAAAAAPFLARWYDSPVLLPVLIVLASNLIWNGASSIPRSLIRKRVDFRRLVLPEVVPFVISNVLAIAMALGGFGVWSLVAKSVVHSLLNMVMLRRLHEGRIRFQYDAVAARELFGYGKFIVATSVLLVALYNIDRLYISRLAGVAAVGYFEVASRFAELPVKQFALIVGSVMFPVLTKLDHTDGSRGRAVVKTMRYAALVSVPIAMVMATFGPLVVHLAYGERWAEMITPLRILTFMAMAQSMASLVHDGFKAHGRPDLMQRAVVLKLGLIAVLGAPAIMAWGIVGMSWLLLSVYAGVLLLEMRMLTRLVNLPYWRSLSVLVAPFALSSIILVGYLLLERLGNATSPWQIGIGLALSCLAYLGALFVVEREAIADLRLAIGSGSRGSQAAASA